MRIAVVCSISTGGGVTEAFITCLMMLLRQGATPIAILPTSASYIDRIQVLGVEIQQVKGLEAGGLVKGIAGAWHLRRSTLAARADMIVAHNGRHVRTLKKIAPRIPLAAVYHSGKAKRFISADRIIAINQMLRDQAIKAGVLAEKVAVVDNVLPMDTLPSISRRRLETHVPTIGSLILLQAYKGPDILLDAVKILKDRGLKVRLKLGGTGPMLGDLKRQADDLDVVSLVEFAGWVTNKPRFFEAIDVFVSPSRVETWGIAIAEAYAYQTPVVATSTPGQSQIVSDEETGLLVQTENPQALAEGIERMLTDKQLAKRLAAAAAQRCAQQYLLPAVAPLFFAEVMRTTIDS